MTFLEYVAAKSWNVNGKLSIKIMWNRVMKYKLRNTVVCEDLKEGYPILFSKYNIQLK